MTEAEKRLKNLTLELQTIDVLAQHLRRTLVQVHPTTAQINASRYLVDVIEIITAKYK